MSQWMEIKVYTKSEAADAVGDILYRNGADGLVIEEQEIYLDAEADINWDYSDVPLSEAPPEYINIVAYLPIDEGLFPNLENIKLALDNMHHYGFDTSELKMSTNIINEEDWAEGWKEYFVPIFVGRQFLICPAWEAQESDERIVINIDPGLAFGTGSHITTQQALILLEKYLLPGQSVIDVGSGSGILSIAAALSKAGSVLALDIDEQAVEMTRKNLSLNEVGDTAITVKQNSLLSGIDVAADLILANITAPILEQLIPQAEKISATGNRLICAGIIEEYEMDVQKALIENNYKIIDRLITGDWVALAAQKVQ